MKVVFDMDTGVDDSLALIYALNRPAYEIQGIGCVYGNVESWLAAENTMKILDLVELSGMEGRMTNQLSGGQQLSVPMNLLQENGPGACLLSMEKTDLEM